MSTSVFVYSYACNLSLVDRCVSVHVCVCVCVCMHTCMCACVFMHSCERDGACNLLCLNVNQNM